MDIAMSVDSFERSPCGLELPLRAWLVVGPVSIRYTALPTRTRPRLVEVADVTGRRELNTVVLPASAVRNLDGLYAAGADLDAEPRVDGAPLFYLASVVGGWRPYTQVLYTPAGLVFLSLGDELLTGDPADETTARTWLGLLGARHRDCGGGLNNHQRFFTVHRPDEEIEHKFTLAPEVDLWSLATRLLATITADGLSDWIGEYRNEFEQWDFLNHLYEIAEPAAQRGYVSFIPAIDGTWIIKRKWFEVDQSIRREHRDRGVLLLADPDLPEEITARFGVTPAWGASFRRVRFDINVESLRTGHGYSVMFDRCTTVTGAPAVLQQCEVEYLRSRTVRPINGAELLAEFSQLCDWVRTWLAGQGVGVIENHLSKLSFLRAVTQPNNETDTAHPLRGSAVASQPGTRDHLQHEGPPC